MNDKTYIISPEFYKLIGECKCHRYERVRGCKCCCDDPELFNELTIQEQETLCNWIDLNLTPIKTINRRTLDSYGLKHRFERSPGGFYVTNGAFKGAMVFEGYKHSHGQDVNWFFNIKKFK